MINTGNRSASIDFYIILFLSTFYLKEHDSSHLPEGNLHQ